MPVIVGQVFPLFSCKNVLNLGRQEFIFEFLAPENKLYISRDSSTPIPSLFEYHSRGAIYGIDIHFIILNYLDVFVPSKVVLKVKME